VNLAAAPVFQLSGLPSNWSTRDCSCFRMQNVMSARGPSPRRPPCSSRSCSIRTTSSPISTPRLIVVGDRVGHGVAKECYLVDLASSHMLVSKIKPCMCICYSDNRSNSRANMCNKPQLLEGMHLLDKRSTRALPGALMIHDNSTDRTTIVLAMHHSNFCPINFRW